MTGPSDPTYPNPLEPPRAPRPGQLLGRVSGIRTRTMTIDLGLRSRQVTVLRFRLQPAGGDAPVKVELRGTMIRGTLREGDWVELPRPQRPGRVRVRDIDNLTGGTLVSATGDPARARRTSVMVVLVFVAVVLLLVAVAALVFVLGHPFAT